MSLAQMSFYGAVLTMVVIIVRALAINRLPKRTFIVLWCVVLIRLLIPFEITSVYSVYSVVGDSIEDEFTAVQSAALLHGGESTQMSEISDMKTPTHASETTGIEVSAQSSGDSESMKMVSRTKGWVWVLIWESGAILCALLFVIVYVRCRMEFGMSLPIYNDYISQWLTKRRRSVSVRVSDRIDAPLTYGIIHPVILLPKKTEWEKTEQLEYILWHEYMHIHYGDNVLKLIMVVTLCIHWFNPFVWAVYFLLNRDIELACDESVVRRCGVSNKSTYANMLISMEAKRSGLVPICNNFSQNAIEERVRAIMKIKKISPAAVIFAAGLVVGVTIAFATSATTKAGQTTMTEASDTDFTQVQDEIEMAAEACQSRIDDLEKEMDAVADLIEQKKEEIDAIDKEIYFHEEVKEYQNQLDELKNRVQKELELLQKQQDILSEEQENIRSYGLLY